MGTFNRVMGEALNFATKLDRSLGHAAERFVADVERLEPRLRNELQGLANRVSTATPQRRWATLPFPPPPFMPPPPVLDTRAASSHVITGLVHQQVDVRKFHEDLHHLLFDKADAAGFHAKYGGVLARAGLPPHVASTDGNFALSRMHDELGRACASTGNHPPSSAPPADLVTMSPSEVLQHLQRGGVSAEAFQTDLGAHLAGGMTAAGFYEKYGSVLKSGGADLRPATLTPALRKFGAELADLARAEEACKTLEPEPKGLTLAVLKKRYMRLALQWHPDKLRDRSPDSVAKATEMFKRINSSNDFLRKYLAERGSS